MLCTSRLKKLCNFSTKFRGCFPAYRKKATVAKSPCNKVTGTWHIFYTTGQKRTLRCCYPLPLALSACHTHSLSAPSTSTSIPSTTTSSDPQSSGIQEQQQQRRHYHLHSPPGPHRYGDRSSLTTSELVLQRQTVALAVAGFDLGQRLAAVDRLEATGGCTGYGRSYGWAAEVRCHS
jgi:hypothetical protein